MATIARTKNAISGTATGIIMQVFNLLIPFFIRSLFIKYIGVEYAGLSSLFTSILRVLNLAELGVGSALVFSMYKPIAEDDNDKICALINLYKIYYRIIGIVVLIIGLVLTPVLPFLISGDVPGDINLYVLYYLNLSTTVVSYWLLAYKISILLAHQRTDVINIATFAVHLVKSAFQVLAIIVWHNYYLYLIIGLFFQLVLNVLIAILTTKIYPQYKPRGSVSKEEKKEINKKVRDLFTGKIASVVVNSADTIVISSFLGLVSLTIFNNYYFILNAINGLFTVFYNAVRAGVANALIVDNENKKKKDFYTLSFICFLLISVCAPCFINLYQPFMIIWVGQDLLMEQSSVYWFVIYFMVYQIPLFWVTYKDAAGIWRQDKFRPLIGASANLILNLLLVNYIGINGILISTIASYVFVSVPWLLVNVKKYIIDYDLKYYLTRLFLYIIVMIASTILSKLICDSLKFRGLVEILVNLAISIIFGGGIFILCFSWTKEFKATLVKLKSILKRKKNLCD